MTIPPDRGRALPLVVHLLGVLLVLTPGVAVAAGSPGSPGSAAEFIKYYVVPASADDRPQRLRDVAARYLGDGDRYRELLALNSARRQSDGGRLTDPDVLRPGWLLVLPWDAAGDGISYGELPVNRPAAAPSAPVPTEPVDPECAVPASGPSSGVPWAQLRLAPTNAWTHGRGGGITVAVVDTG
ncbi:peptidase S8 and S53 subtilisin kexin sedolisin, partial [Micromonospora zhanjiangensis]